MFSDTTIGCNEETLGTEDESLEDINYFRVQVSKLSLENEKFKQENHDLHRKLEVSRSMEEELGEVNKTLEQHAEREKAQTNRRIHEIEEKHAGIEKELQDKLADAEAELGKITEENKELRESIKMNNEKLSSLSPNQCSTSTEDNCELLKCEIEELTEVLAQERDVRKQREETIQVMEREFAELREILAATKEQLVEKNKVAESMRGELFDCRMELESLKAAPATDKSKGNSLFAEVEDRRKMTLDQMNAMRSSYLETKRSFQAKESEIRSLKAERSLLLRKWEDDTVEKIQQDSTLVEKYKARIGELETQLKDERKKLKETTKGQQLPENNFTFLQSLVDAKSKKIEELITKIESDSIKALLDEEMKHKMGKQLRYWRYRAMSGEAELLSIKNRLEFDPSSSNVEILETIKKRFREKITMPNETLKYERSYRDETLVNETIVTLDSLMRIPKPTPTPGYSSLSSFNDLSDETIDSLKLPSNDNILTDDRTIIKTESMIIDSPINKLARSEYQRMQVSMEIEEETREMSQIFAPVKQEGSEEKYENSSGAMIEPVLKSMLGKTNEKTSLIFSRREKNEREKKTLRFTNDTKDPPSKTLKKQPTATPNYPIVFISGNKSKKS